MILYILVEGQTEEKFVKETLYKHLFSFAIFAYPILFSTGKKNLRTHKGGIISYSQVKKNLMMLIRQFRNRQDVHFTTMVDLFHLDRLHDKFPGFEDASKISDKYKLVTSLEESFRKDINHQFDKFIPYIQLHEFESLLFSDPAKFDSQIDDSRKIDRLNQILKDFSNPELINDEDAPSYRIKEIFPAYDKVRHGAIISNRIGLNRIRSKCSHFNEWIIKLEQLGNA